MADPKKINSENERLKIAIDELKILNDIATSISSIQSVDKIIDEIILKCIKHLEVDEGTVSLLERNDEADEFHTLIRHKGSQADKIPFKLDTRIKGWMLKNKRVLMSNDIQDDEQLASLGQIEVPFRSILCVPLMVKGHLTGYLAVFNKKNEAKFTNQDKRLLSIIGSQSAQLIESARLYEEEKKLLSLHEELKMAWKIQQKLLPENEPEMKGYEISAVNIPAKSVGGDYYDFITLPSGKLGFCVGDITGKGMPAAMLMANLQATIRSQAAIFEDSSTCIQGTNKLLFRSTEPGKFATIFYGILEAETGHIEFTNGGHDAPLLIKKNKENILLEATGLLIGVMEEASYEKGSITLESGDLLCIYTDGITEAMNSEGVEYGVKRLHQCLNKHYDESAENIKDLIISSVKEHVQNAPQSDDITLMVIKKSEN